MKTSLKVVILGLVLITFTGCFEFKTVININPDGSGTVEETVLVSSMVVEMMTQFTGSFADSAENTEKFSFFNKEELEKRAGTFGNSVTYVSSEELKIDDREGYKAIYSFTNLNELKINQDPGTLIGMDSMEDSTGESTLENDILFQFQKGNPSVITINLPNPGTDNKEEEQDSASVAEMDSSSFEQVTALMEDLRMSMIINIDGSITETNASYKDGSKITLMDLNFNELLKNKEKLEGLKSINPSDMEQVKELLKDVMGMQMEFNNPVIIKFN